jgi:hypothetical protein
MGMRRRDPKRDSIARRCADLCRGESVTRFSIARTHALERLKSNAAKWAKFQCETSRDDLPSKSARTDRIEIVYRHADCS